MLQVPAPSVQIIRAVLREYHAATHTAEVEPVLGPASLVGEIPVLMSCRPDLLTTGREVAVLTWSDVSGLVLGPYGAVPDDPPNAGDADTVDGIHASATATANKLLALNASSKLPASITGDADTVDSIHAAASATANKLLALDASSKLPASITGDADTVDSIHAATTPTASKLLAMNANAKFPTHTIAGALTLEGALIWSLGRLYPDSNDLILEATTDDLKLRAVGEIRLEAGSHLAFEAGGEQRWVINTSGHLYPWPTNTYTSGLSVARTANIYSVLGNFSGCVADGTCEIFTEDALAIIKDIHAHGTGQYDEHGHEHFDMAWMFGKYPFLIYHEEDDEYLDRLGAKSDLLYRVIQLDDHRLAADAEREAMRAEIAELQGQLDSTAKAVLVIERRG